jgi:drug/metabolite transporter (DMT)-like permease
MRAKTSSDLQAEWLTQLGGIGLVNLATLSWATNMTLGRHLRDDIGPLTLAAAWFLIASVCFALLLRRQPLEDRLLGKDRWLLVGMALSGVAVFAPVLYLGLRHTTAVNSTLINGAAPLITGVLAALLITEPMSKQQVWGALASFVGVVVLISGGQLLFWQAMGNVGDLIVLGAVLLWGLYSVLGRQVMRHRSALSATALSAFLGLPLLLLAAAWEMRGSAVDISPKLVLAILYIGIVPTVVGFLSWNAGVRRLGPSGAMVSYNTLPLYGIVLGYLLLGEPIGWSHLLGGALIVGGGLWAARSPRDTNSQKEDENSEG